MHSPNGETVTVPGTKPVAERVLAGLQNHPVREPWERTVANLAVSILARDGIQGLSRVVDAPGSLTDPGVKLTTREMSELVSVLENAEADRLVRSREILKEILTFALKAADELLKAALGGLL